MPISLSGRLALLALGSLTALAIWLALPGGASASVGADLRVINTEGRALAQLRQFTDTAQIKTDPNADCFGPGSQGSGSTVTVNGPTALGVVNDAEATQRAIRPVSVTDAFGFGLGICGFGGYRSETTRFWYLKVNHAESSVGGDQVLLKGGDDVVWYLIRTSSCPPPDYFCQVSDLLLSAPARVRANSQAVVTVSAFSRTGVQSPATGAFVSGGSAPATVGADGRALVQFGGQGSTRLFAVRGNDIPSQSLPVCVSEQLSSCPRSRGKTIAGSDYAETIHGSPGADKVKARGGDDTVIVRGGSADRVSCGGGKDTVKADGRDKVGGSCERVIR